MRRASEQRSGPSPKHRPPHPDPPRAASEHTHSLLRCRTQLRLRARPRAEWAFRSVFCTPPSKPRARGRLACGVNLAPWLSSGSPSTSGRHVAASGHGQPLSCDLSVLLRSARRLLLRPDPRCTSSTPGCRGRRATIDVAAALCSCTWTKPGSQGGGSWREPGRAFIIRRRRYALGGWRLIKHLFGASCMFL